MKTAISIPDQLFEAAEQTAARLGCSRSQFYARALESFIADQDDDPVTAALNDVVDGPNRSASVDAGTDLAGRSLIETGQWEW